jgi:calcium/calmodulin-dependent protein kinase I
LSSFRIRDCGLFCCWLTPNRDLKPENIIYRTKDAGSDIVIVDFEMYAAGLFRKIVPDFASSAKQLVTPDELLYDVQGSFGYVAPEVLSQQGYGKSVDVWSAG